MPSASQETIDKMVEHFGDGNHGDWESEAIKHLKEQGYRWDQFQWHPKEGVKTVDDMTEKEYIAMWYLITEWDWGGLINATQA